MELRLRVGMLSQPDEITCGPTCLHAVYRFFGDAIALPQVIAQVPRLEDGGTLAVLLACHALQRGYQATIYTYNLQIFDPTWFLPGAPDLRGRLEGQLRGKRNKKLEVATHAYLEFLERGGVLRFEDLTAALIRRFVHAGIPILTGLSATYLYRSAREKGPLADYDDLLGEPSGHFVVICGYDREERSVAIADPLLPNPVSESNHYVVDIDRLICAILLGILTYDDNLLIVRPRQPATARSFGGAV